jgi:hypothetical protein
MSAEKIDVAPDAAAGKAETSRESRRAPYEPPRIEKRRSVARVTLVSNMGQMGVGVAG